MKTLMIAMFCAAAIPAAAMAEPAQPAEIGYAEGSLGFSAMMGGDWKAAERQLEQSSPELRNDPAHMLNLAQVYQATGREEQARETYRKVLGLEDMVLVLSDGRKVSAHEIAQVKLATQMQAAR